MSDAIVLLLLAAPARAGSLGDLLKGRRPWETWEANSDQRQPVYLGESPLELALRKPGGPARLPAALRAAGELQFRRLLARFGVPSAQFEAWPAYDDYGRLTWAAARWRPAAGSPWRWLDGPDAAPEGALPMHLPRLLRVSEPAAASAVFDDFSTLKDLYDKPVFGDCVWTKQDGIPVAGWLPPDAREAARGTPPAPLCRVLPMPSFLDGRPKTFVVAVSSAGVSWPARLSWSAEPAVPAAAAAPSLPWPSGFAAAFMGDARGLAGEDPLPGTDLRLSRKSSAQKDNQLGDVLSWLERRYAALGLKTRRVRFTWRGIPQADLVAVVPGSLPAAKQRPVVVADHIDTAFCEDVFKASGTRVSAPGADDNASATAALLLMAPALRAARLRHDVWLVHLTGEEFPADDLGARRLIAKLLHEKRRLGGVLVLDMVGWHRPGDPVFQVSAGDGPEALRIASSAAALAAQAAPGYTAALRARWDPESYLYNTDAFVFAHAGYPAVLFNEHLNAKRDIDRDGYHDSTDLSYRLDPAYAGAVARTAAETAAWLAR